MSNSRRRSRRRRARRHIPGTAPGTLRVDPEARQPKLRVIRYGPDSLHEHADARVDELRDLRSKSPVVWVDVVGLGDAEVLAAIGAEFGLHRLALEDVINVHQRPKVEDYADHLFLVTRLVHLVDGRIETEQVSLFVGRDWLVSFQERPEDCFEPLRQRLRQGGGRSREAGADYLAYALLDSVVDSYFPVLEAYGDRLEQIETQLLERPRSSSVATLHELKRDLLAFRRVVWPQRESLSSLQRGENRLVHAETRTHLRDCHDHAIHALDMIETYRELAAGLVDLYLSSVSNRMNEVMKVLTVIATIFIPLSFIAGVYGMNFDTRVSPLNMPELEWYWGYPFSLGLMAVVAAGLLLFFWRRGWLSDNED